MQAAKHVSWWSQHQDLWVGILIGGVITLVVSAAFYYLTLDRRGLEYTIEVDRPLTVTGYSDKLAVVFDGEVMSEPRIVVIQLTNRGKSAIRRDDWIEGESGKFTFPEAKIRTVATVGQSDGVVWDEWTEAESALFLSQGESVWSMPPLLMNSGSHITLQFVVDCGIDRLPLFSAIIPGQVMPHEVGPQQFSYRRLAFGVGILLLIPAIFAAASDWRDPTWLVPIIGALGLPFVMRLDLRQPRRHLGQYRE